MLFDLWEDYGEQTDLAQKRPEVVESLASEFEKWWQSARPMMVNEEAPLAAENSYWTLFRKQFGNLPVLPEEEARPKGKRRPE
jgi:hypothetical protein